VIDNLSFGIAPGEKVGLVGRSGAGKTTIASLLLRFHDVEAGRVLIDDQDVAAVTRTVCASRSAWSRRTRPCCIVQSRTTSSTPSGRADRGGGGGASSACA
jgi:ABC-type glutathione transport system ATPase component